MKRSRRLIRNTILAMGGLVVLYVLASRWFGEDTSPRQEQSAAATDLAALRDFSAITVHGNFSVDIVQQTEYSVTRTPGSPQIRFNANVVDGMLNLRSFDTANAIGVRVGMPVLAQLKASGRPSLTVSGFGGDSIDLRLGEVSRVVLRHNSVRQWHIFASDAGELQIDRASMNAGKVNVTGRASLSVID